MPARITTQQRQAVLDLHKAGRSRNDISRETGVSAGSVTNIIREHGGSFDRSATEAATKARSIDLAAVKQQRLEAELLILELEQRDVLAALEGRSSWPTIMRGEGGSEREAWLSFIPAVDRQRAHQGRSSIARIIKDLEPKDTAREDSAIDQWLTHMVGPEPEPEKIADGR